MMNINFTAKPPINKMYMGKEPIDIPKVKAEAEKALKEGGEKLYNDTRAAMTKPVEKTAEPLVDELSAMAYRNAHGIK